MKRTLFVFSLLLFPLCVLQAQGPGGGQGKGRGQHLNQVSPEGGGITNLYTFLSLPDDKLLELEESIRRIRNMSPGERAALKKKIEEYHQLPQNKRQALYQAWGRLNPEIQEAWRNYMQTLNNEEKAAIHEKLDSVPQDERINTRVGILKENGLLPKE